MFYTAKLYIYPDEKGGKHNRGIYIYIYIKTALYKWNTENTMPHCKIVPRLEASWSHIFFLQVSFHLLPWSNWTSFSIGTKKNG